jgi:hypothetical protein
LTNNQENWGTVGPFRGDEKNPFFIKHQKFYPSVKEQIKAAEKRISPMAKIRDMAAQKGKFRKELEKKEGKPVVGKKELDKYVAKMKSKGKFGDKKL